MSDLRIVGITVQLVLALALVGLGAMALGGRIGMPRAWLLLWGRAPRRADGAALAVLGLGVGAWALTQTVDLVALALQLGAVGVVVVGAVAVVVLQAGVPDDATR